MMIKSSSKSLLPPCHGPVIFAMRRLLVLLPLLLLLLACLSPSFLVQGMAPPHPQWKDFESVHKMRKRLNITFNYTPVHYPMEQCRYSTEEACRQMDQDAERAKERKRQQQRGLNPSTSSGDGTIKILVFLMHFPEHAGVLSSLPPKSYFEELLNGAGTSEINPAGSVKDYFYINSVKQFKVEFVVQDWAQTEESESYYSNGQAMQDGDLLRKQSLFRNQLEALDQSGYDWAPHDSNADGYLDGIMAFHSGMAAELGNEDCEPDYLQRIWSQAIQGAAEGGWVSSSGFVFLDGFAISGATGRPFCDPAVPTDRVYTPTNMAIATHELSHTWNMADYYDMSGEDLGSVGGLGSFDIMANAYGFNYDGSHPGMYSAYNKIKAGWMTATPITQDGFYPIMPIETSGQAYLISDPYPEGEYLLIESRYPYLWSSDLPDQGIVIYHVDESAPTMEKRGYPGKSGWPTDHYQVAVQQKDGNYDIEQGVNPGDATDFWVMNDVLGPGPDTWPNTDSYQGSQTATGLTIKITTEPGLITQFQVTGFKTWNPAPAADGSLFAPNNSDGNAKTEDSSSSSSSSSSTSGAAPAAIFFIGSRLLGVAGALVFLAAAFF